MSNRTGQLHVVATPIGNLGDISARACEILASVDHIAAEDTRHSRQLLQRLGIKGALVSLHEHNETERIERVLGWLDAGESVALISDAGTPLISDPGYRLVRALHAAGYPVLAVPGPSSVIAALSIAGLPTDRFFYEGFLPPRAGPRRRRLEALASAGHTLVFLEAGRRVLATLEVMVDVFGGERESAVCRELTKRFETTRTDSLSNLLEWVQADSDQVRGEFVLVVGPPPQAPSPEAVSIPAAEELVRMLRREGLGARSTARVVARLTGESTNNLYRQATEEDRDTKE
ncbi:16S rRNA (cytidine(1402)-2'-O)-methyltransferase [Spiribacter vilamensis]|uniref:Ribosomal RNA small subunit methyltransferase I n=1 Tax=Spiribacter vilamensis TaxID=531306 RepID=A0A4Q8CY60_9GAMM|nr:16S rRNA (cytidine(1402)-2'-O)-methyltransferase [Spiribacter vilamensis]RZU97903.1 16S rRNA (cytidine1402-2'-O)-methyltransferase [Spiribacter vilamensis]TVO61183.1 16S rRNA (cytidine(1402)-2'-O)-methyltransferase [Spiribacter vilamensis]